jgi:ribosomal protein S18 acetylase RimI-like enzyme
MKAVSSTAVVIRQMLESDLVDLDKLIHAAYRGGKSSVAWKNEHDLVSGRRIDEDGLARFLGNESALVLVAERPIAKLELSEDNSPAATSELCGSVLIERESPDSVVIGMLSVRPDYQNSGLGRQLVVAAEKAAVDLFKATCARMHVIAVRKELLDWYRRLGCQMTGQLKPFPDSDAGKEPLQDGLQFAVVEKKLGRCDIG